jgi:hypothetical protein
MAYQRIIAAGSAALILATAPSAFAQSTGGAGTSQSQPPSASPSTATGTAAQSGKMSGTDTSTTGGTQNSSDSLGHAGGAPPSQGGARK